MNDNQELHKQSEATHVSISRKRKLKNPLSRKATLILSIVVGVAALLGAVYYLGFTNGENKQKAVAKKTLISPSASNASTSRRWSAIGSVTDISEKQIKIKDSRGQEQTAVINKDTVITGADGKKTDFTAIKKDSRVIGTGTKNEKGNTLTATRIRIQK